MRGPYLGQDIEWIRIQKEKKDKSLKLLKSDFLNVLKFEKLS